MMNALSAEDPSTRLNAALAIGTRADPGPLDALLARCAVEPDFFVRDMLTWALTRLPAELTVPRLLVELRSPVAQGRSQALHTLSKIGDRRAWPSITGALLHDADDDVARAAWRTAVVLAPAGAEPELAGELAAELGRGDRAMWLSLSQALAALPEAATPLLSRAADHDDPGVRAHARATLALLDDPDSAFDLAVEEARRVVALGPDREPEDDRVC